MNHKDILIRSLKTGLVAFLAVFGAGIGDLLNAFNSGGLTALKAAGLALAVSAITAALTATLNYAIQIFSPKA